MSADDVIFVKRVGAFEWAVWYASASDDSLEPSGLVRWFGTRERALAAAHDWVAEIGLVEHGVVELPDDEEAPMRPPMAGTTVSLPGLGWVVLWYDGRRLAMQEFPPTPDGAAEAEARYAGAARDPAVKQAALMEVRRKSTKVAVAGIDARRPIEIDSVR